MAFIKAFFCKKLADFLNEQCGWKVSEKNIAVSNGSQSAFFVLHNMFAGRMSDAHGLLAAKACVSVLISSFSHECGIFSSSPSSHNLVRNLMNRIVQGRC